MIGDGAETPSRRELLTMVKKHSNLIGKTTVDEQDAYDVGMDSKFWHDVFDLYFVRGKEPRGRHGDDLIFLVRKMSSQAYHDNPDGVSSFFLGWWASKKDKLVGDISDSVDWRRSFYLNLIAHTSYTVTVAICSLQDLRNHQAGQDTPLSPIYKVVKTVYASPSRITFDLDAKKEVETSPAHPDICFAIYDFDSTLDAVVLSSTDHCYCVLLNAHDGAAFPSTKEPSDCSSSKEPPSNFGTSPGNSNSNKKTFIHMTMRVADIFLNMHPENKTPSQGTFLPSTSGKSQFGSLLSLGHSPGKADRLYMKGPGGRGEVEVAVSGVVDQSRVDAGPFSPVSVSKRGIGSIFLKAATVASVAAKHACAAASATTSHEGEMIPLKCCLMSLSLPWDHIAYDLLFKRNPPVNL